MIADARLGLLSHELVDLRLGGDVDPTRRLIEDEDPGSAVQPAAHQHALLISAAEVPDGLLGAPAADVQRPDRRARRRPVRLAGVDEAEP